MWTAMRVKKSFSMRFFNASYETGFMNPIDEAIRKYREFDLSWL